MDESFDHFGRLLGTGLAVQLQRANSIKAELVTAEANAPQAEQGRYQAQIALMNGSITKLNNYVTAINAVREFLWSAVEAD